MLEPHDQVVSVAHGNNNTARATFRRQA
jgi:hypothetical protein